MTEPENDVIQVDLNPPDPPEENYPTWECGICGDSFREGDQDYYLWVEDDSRRCCVSCYENCDEYPLVVFCDACGCPMPEGNEYFLDDVPLCRGCYDDSLRKTKEDNKDYSIDA